MRDLLFLAHRIPFPPDKGDKIRSFHILEHLRKTYRIHLGCFFDDPADAGHIAELAQNCASANCQPLSLNVKRRRGLAGITRGQSITAASYQDAGMRRWVNDTVRRHNICDAFIFSSAMAQYVEPLSQTMRIVTDLVDMDSQKWRIYADNASFAPEFLYRREQQKVLELERNAARISEHVLLVSEAEAESCRALLPEFSNRFVAVPNGVDGAYFDPALDFSNPYNPARPAIIFAGAMDYAPNVDAVTWFADAVFPKVQETQSQVEFWVVGSNPKNDVLRLERRGNIQITGRVNDVRPYLAHAACVVAPMRMARGIQNKVLEGMAMARPVIVTPAALVGLEAKPGRDIQLAQSIDDFAARVAESLHGSSASFGRSARNYVLEHHNWQKNLHILDELMRSPNGADGRQPCTTGALV